MTRLYDRALGGTGLGVAQFTLLYVLEQQGGNPMMQSALGEILSLDSTTLTRTLAPLARRGCVRSRPGADRRERLWVIAPRGKRELERALPRWERVQERMRSRIGARHWDVLLDETKRVAIAARMRAPDGLRPEKE
ncbi:MAG: MarR family winged helix-turn-helix transcriptional regulator [Gemmatimonadales bacterium]